MSWQNIGTLVLILPLFSCRGNSPDEASSPPMHEQTPLLAKEVESPIPPRTIAADAALPKQTLHSFQSTSVREVVVELGKLDPVTLAHFKQAFPGQSLLSGGEPLSSDISLNNASIQVQELGLDLSMQDYKLKHASLDTFSEIEIAGIKNKSQFKRVLKNEELECFYQFYEAGSLRCYLPDNWNFATGFEGRNADRIAKPGPISAAKAKKIALRKKVDWISWERYRTVVRD